MTSSPTVVSRFEANLLTILQFLLRRVPESRALPVILKAHPRPQCLSRACVDLVQDTLAKGTMLLLARGGGWRQERHLRNGAVVEGRLWERTPPDELGLHFSVDALAFLIWMTATELPAKDGGGLDEPDPGKLTMGDWLLYHHAYAALRLTTVGPMLRGQLRFQANALCRLSFPADFAHPVPKARCDLHPWTAGAGGSILEAMQEYLRARWRNAEANKERLDPRRLRPLGQGQERLLSALFDAVENAGRFDLARFFLLALADVLADSQAYQWLGQVSVTGLRIADRVALYRAALAPVVMLERLHDWEQQARGIGYFDEGYAAGQLFLADWEAQHGDDLVAHGQNLLRRWGAWQAPTKK